MCATWHTFGGIMRIPTYKIRLHPLRRTLGPIPKPKPYYIDYLMESGGEGIPALLLQESGGDFNLVSGEQWWLAAQVCNIEELPATLCDSSEGRVEDLLHVEYAKEGDPIQIAKMAEKIRLGPSGGKPLSVAEVARLLQMDRATVAHHLRLLRLIPELQEKVSTGNLSVGKVKPLISLPPAIQRKVAERVESQDWTVRRVEQVVSMLRKGESPKPSPENKDPNTIRAENVISETLGMPARISWQREQGGSGELTLRFDNLEVLEGLLERLGVTL